MSAERCRKTRAVLLLAILTVAEGRRVSSSVRADDRFQSAGSARHDESLALARRDDAAKLQEQMRLAPEHIRVIMDDPGLLEQSKLVAEEIEALAREPEVQKWRQLVTQSVEKLAESSHIEEHARLAANQLSAMMEQTSKLLVEQSEQRAKVFSERMKVIAEHIEAILEDPEVQDLAEAASREFLAITEDPEFMERVRLAAEQVGSIMEHVEALTAHLTLHQTGAGPASESFSLAEVERSRVSFLPSVLKRRGHQSLSGTASGSRSKTPSIVGAPPQRALPRRANGAEMSAGDATGEASLAESVGKVAIDLGVLALRLGTCALMVHHGLDKIQNVDGFSANVVAKFFGFLPGPPQFWTYSAAATQIAGAGLLGAGFLSRPVAASMTGTMIAAVTFHLLNTGAEEFPFGVPKAHSYNFELAAMYVLVLSYFTLSGGGKYSVDEQVFGGELKIYKGLLDKLLSRGSQ